MFSHLASSCRYRANRGRQNQGCQQSLLTPSLYLQLPCIKSPFGNFGIHLASMCPWRYHYNFSVVALVLSAFLIPPGPRNFQLPLPPPPSPQEEGTRGRKPAVAVSCFTSIRSIHSARACSPLPRAECRQRRLAGISRSSSSVAPIPTASTAREIDDAGARGRTHGHMDEREGGPRTHGGAPQRTLRADGCGGTVGSFLLPAFVSFLFLLACCFLSSFRQRPSAPNSRPPFLPSHVVFA